MKILICSKLFEPSNKIGAVRPSNFAKYLAMFGNDVTVITELNNQISNNLSLPFKIIHVSKSINAEYINNKFKREKLIVNKGDNEQINSHSRTKGLLSKFYNSFFKFYKSSRRQVFMLIFEFGWFLNAKRRIKKEFGRNSFDVVISSFGPISSLLLGGYARHSGIAKKWICDLRDNIRNEDFPFWLNLCYCRVEKNIIKKADLITFVSNGQLQMFVNNNKPKDINSSKLRVFFNGYEPDNIQKNPVNDNILRIVYTGQLYEGKRDLTMLFDVINILIKNELIDINLIQFHYAGGCSLDLIKQSNKFKYTDQIIVDHGLVDRSTSLEIQRQADLLVVASWNSIKEQGILTGKFFEYLNCNKPIIALISGNLHGSELKKMITDLDLGIACEYNNYDEHSLRLKNYILGIYNSFLLGQNSNIYFNKNKEIFKYCNIVKELNQTIHSLI